MSLPRHKYLITYRLAEIAQDGGVEFCEKFLADYKFKRTVEQIVQALRSGKQNIVEGVGQSETSKKGEIKLLGVAVASFEEAISDFEDFFTPAKFAHLAKNRLKNSKISGFEF